MATRRVKVSPEPVPKKGSLERVAARRPGSTEFKPNLRPAEAPSTADTLLVKEVLLCTSPDNKNPRFAGILEPSDGLEPSTPSLPWRFEGEDGVVLCRTALA